MTVSDTGSPRSFQNFATNPVNLGLTSIIAGEATVQAPSSHETARLPCAVSCVSRLIDLRRLRHPNLVRYIDAQYDKRKRIFVVTEHYNADLSMLTTLHVNSGGFRWLVNKFSECLTGLQYLSGLQIVHGSICPSSILFDRRGVAKIGGYGIYYASRWGIDVDFPTFDPLFSAPEIFLVLRKTLNGETAFEDGVNPPCPLDSRSDIWSLVLVFLAALCGDVTGTFLRESCPEGKPSFLHFLLDRLRNALKSDSNDSLLNHLKIPFLPSDSDEFLNLCKSCLAFDVRKRLAINEVKSQFDAVMRNLRSELPPGPMSEPAVRFLEGIEDAAEVYYFWCLAGGDLPSVLAASETQSNQDQTKSFEQDKVTCRNCEYPPILRIPSYLAPSFSRRGRRGLSEGFWPFNRQPVRPKYCPSVILLPAGRLLKRIADMPTSLLYPLLFPDTYCCLPTGAISGDTSGRLGGKIHNHDQPSPSPPPPTPLLSQCCLVNALESSGVEDWDLSSPAFPAQRYLLKHQDAPHTRRVRVRDGLVKKRSSVSAEGLLPSQPVLVREHDVAYQPQLSSQPSRQRASKLEPTTAILSGLSEKALSQIAVDLPRCHAYDPLMASPLGQSRLRSVLIATLLSNAGRFEYTQGMDSLAAVFTRLIFHNPQEATACLTSLLSLRLPTFFSTKRFAVGLKSYFNLLLPLLAFHLPCLAAHFARLNVPLTGLTTGWIYTLFSHSMPLDRTEILWDSLLAGPASLPMFIYVAIFYQLDQQIQLQTLNLEKICTVLSNFPDLNLDRCRTDALAFAAATPVSLTVSSAPLDSSSAPLSLFNETHFLTGPCPRSRRSTITQNGFSCPNCQPDWPKHLDAPLSPDWLSTESAEVSLSDDHPATPGSSATDCHTLDNSLVPRISLEDAARQLKREDCAVLTIKSKEDSQSERLPNFINFPMHKIPKCTMNSRSRDSSLSPFASVRRQPSPRKCPRPEGDDTFAQLCSDPVWLKASEARKRLDRRGVEEEEEEADEFAECPHPPLAPSSPGLVLVLNESGPEDASGVSLACWLIERGIDRVCLVDGSIRTFLNSPLIPTTAFDLASCGPNTPSLVVCCSKVLAMASNGTDSCQPVAAQPPAADACLPVVTSREGASMHSSLFFEKN
ncbi:unnamed protein product [Schistocephalus solidus]|uniref:non-specific serine/threonine protein kinase n=1 Tax=Schistocephalus solidus TaxID=70667 RepID=A0A183T459_SCHSO|nr:unnamed protein product [Schistocephalus solidus]